MGSPGPVIEDVDARRAEHQDRRVHGHLAPGTIITSSGETVTAMRRCRSAATARAGQDARRRRVAVVAVADRLVSRPRRCWRGWGNSGWPFPRLIDVLAWAGQRGRARASTANAFSRRRHAVEIRDGVEGHARRFGGGLVWNKPMPHRVGYWVGGGAESRHRERSERSRTTTSRDKWGSWIATPAFAGSR